MEKPTYRDYGRWILLAEAVGALSGWLSRSGMERYSQTVTQPPLSPPSWLFPVVWTILFALMGIGAARVSKTAPGKARSRGLNLFVIQLIFNFFWSLIFFNAQAYGLALIWLLALWVLVLGMALAFYKVDPVSGWLQLPYLLWLTFAAYLNWGVWQLNW